MKEFEKEAISLLKRIWMERGFDQLSATILAILFIEPKDLTMEELVAKTGYSLASISTKVKHLSNFRLLHKYTKPGTKKVFLALEKDFLKLWNEAMKEMNAKMELYQTEIEALTKRYAEKVADDRSKALMKNLSMLVNGIKKIKPLFEELAQRMEGI